MAPGVERAPSAEEASPAVAHAVHPWIRYWARILDYWLLTIPVGLMLGYLAPQLAANTWANVLLACPLSAAWIGVETILLARLGTTPGKWLFRVRIRNADNAPIPLRKALARSYKVWWHGHGMGLPGFSIISAAVGCATLIRHGVTPWDRDEGFVVEHCPLGIVRGLLLATLVFGTFAASYVFVAHGNR